MGVWVCMDVCVHVLPCVIKQNHTGRTCQDEKKPQTYRGPRFHVPDIRIVEGWQKTLSSQGQKSLIPNFEMRIGKKNQFLVKSEKLN